MTESSTGLLSLELKIETDRIDLLYKQNIQGLILLSALASVYACMAWSSVSHTFLIGWATALFISAIVRGGISLAWRIRRRKPFKSVREIHPWANSVEVLLLVSGCGWGLIAWRIPSEDTGTALITCIAVLLMMAGAIVAYSASFRAMLSVCIPSLLLWAISLFIADAGVYHVMGGMLLFAFCLSLIVGRNFHHYVVSSLRLAVEHAQLTDSLQVRVREQADQLIGEALLLERAQVEAQSRAKTVLLANASHEIRTPLAAINGYAEMLLQNNSLNDEARGDLLKIVRNGTYLSSLVNDLLDLSKIENGQMYIQKSRISPSQEIRDVVDLMRPHIEGRGLKLALETLTPLPQRIESDSTRLREILINLLSNAAKFTDHGSVTMTVSMDLPAGLLRIAVKDTGIGLSLEGAKGLFQPFMRGDSARVQQVQGSGLGLALSRNLARLLGGDVRLVSTKEGRGCEFEFTLAMGEISDEEFVPQGLAPKAVSASRLKGTNILVVDDSKDLQALMRRFLERQGANVEVRDNGIEAVASVRDRSYDLILMDIKMPIMDGYEATQAMRLAGYDQPIVAVTAHASTDDRQRCVESGFDSYVSKPVDFRHLADDLSKFLPQV